MSEQQDFWEREHSRPEAIKQLAQGDLSSAVRRFYDWLMEHGAAMSNGISMGCGKGRNEIGLAVLGIQMVGLDYSSTAVVEATERARTVETTVWACFSCLDVTKSWPIPSNSRDIGLDSFALADVESPEGRKFAAKEMTRVLRPGGHLLVYTLSPDDEYSARWLKESPRQEEHNTYTPPSGKFEKCFDLQELVDLYSGLRPVVTERVEKSATYDGKTYACRHHWVIFQK